MKTKTLFLFVCSCLLINVLFAIEIPLTRAQIQISVSITGYVDRPGTYQTNSFSRLSEALELGKPIEIPKSTELVTPIVKDLTPNTIMPAKTSEEDDNLKDQALRSVAIIREGKTQYYDLHRFYLNGDLEQNPLLKDGDVIHVKAIQKVVSIQGSVYTPGDYEYLKGDKLKDILMLARGSNPKQTLRKFSFTLSKQQDIFRYYYSGFWQLRI